MDYGATSRARVPTRPQRRGRTMKKETLFKSIGMGLAVALLWLAYDFCSATFLFHVPFLPNWPMVLLVAALFSLLYFASTSIADARERTAPARERAAAMRRAERQRKRAERKARKAK